MTSGEQRAAPAEPGRDLIKDQQHAVRGAGLAQHPQVARVMEAHPARALDHGFHDHRGQRVRVLLDQGRQRRRVRGIDAGREASRRCGGEHLVREHPVPHGVHAAFGIAYRHRHERVTVVPATESTSTRW